MSCHVWKHMCCPQVKIRLHRPYRNAYYSPHKHSGLTTHLILSGELTVSYPDDAQPTKEKFGVGGRLDVDAGRKHEVWMGPEGCTYVIGE